MDKIQSKLLIPLVNTADKHSCTENIVLPVTISSCRNGKYLITPIASNFAFLLLITLHSKRFKSIHKRFARFASYTKILRIILNRNVGPYKTNIFDGLHGLSLWLTLDHQVSIPKRTMPQPWTALCNVGSWNLEIIIPYANSNKRTGRVYSHIIIDYRILMV